MQINADLGESYGSWNMGNDAEIMPFIDQANVACGYHAGDPLVMQTAIGLAKQHHVDLGAHISYPDLQGFGRRSMHIAQAELIPMIQAQIATLEGLAKCQNMALTHIKPHGALYNDMMQNTEVFITILRAIAGYHQPYPLVIQALVDNQQHIALAKQYGVSIILEAFADRAYTDEGYLQSRSQVGAVLSLKQAIMQASKLINRQAITSFNGKPLSIHADTLCVHSDTPVALELSEKVHALIHHIP